MGVAERRAREKEELRAEILNSAAELFLKEGYQNVSMRKIADRIEYAPSTIYLYFKDKAELCQTICVETFEKLTAELKGIARLGLPPEEELRRSLRSYIEFGLGHPQEYLFTFCTPAPVGDEFSQGNFDAVMKSGMEAFDLLRKGLSTCMAVGVIRTQNVELAAQLVYAMIHGLTSLLVLNCGFPFLEREVLIDGLIDHVVRGLK